MASFADATATTAATATATALPRLIEGLEMAHDTPVEEIVNKIYEFWKSNSFINFVKDVSYTMRPILLIKGFPNEKYKVFLSYFAFNYLDYPKAFITALFFSALEQNAITGTIRIVADDHDWGLVRDKSSEKVFVDSGLLTKLKELSSIIPLILSDGRRVYGTHAKNAVINNTIIRMLSDKRPDDKRPDYKKPDYKKPDYKRSRNRNNNNSKPSKKQKIGHEGGTRKRRRRLKATRRLHWSKCSLV
jgi:hypothetical protein